MGRPIVLVDIGNAMTLSGVLPSVALHASYAAKVTARGGVAPYSYSIVDGGDDLAAAGITLDSATGYLVSDNVLVAGSFPITVRATDASGASLVRQFVITVIAEPLTLSGDAQDGTVGVAFHYQYVVAGGTPPYMLALQGGALPRGLAISADGILTGVPIVDGTFNWELRLTDASGAQTSLVDTCTVAASPHFYLYRFSGDGAFTLPVQMTLWMLAVGGGGSGGAFGGGGGGGGGAVDAQRELPAGSYAVAVGSGGPARVNGGNGYAGGTTSIAEIMYATGGGGGLSGTGGKPGGSSGAGYLDGTVVRGPNAGDSSGVGGGGGAAAAAANDNNGGAGYFVSWLGEYYGGGGGASSNGGTCQGGIGGGGTGGYNDSSVMDATDGTGGGGGGRWITAGNHGKGGSGVVVVLSAIPLATSGSVTLTLVEPPL